MAATIIKREEEKLIHWRMICQSWFHSRKALLFLVVFCIANVGLFLHLLNGDQWVDVVKWSVAGYMAGNAGSAIAVAIAGGQAAPTVTETTTTVTS